VRHLLAQGGVTAIVPDASLASLGLSTADGARRTSPG
jgi:hypothetical protein